MNGIFTVGAELSEMYITHLEIVDSGKMSEFVCPMGFEPTKNSCLRSAFTALARAHVQQSLTGLRVSLTNTKSYRAASQNQKIYVRRNSYKEQSNSPASFFGFWFFVFVVFWFLVFCVRCDGPGGGARRPTIPADNNHHGIPRGPNRRRPPPVHWIGITNPMDL